MIEKILIKNFKSIQELFMPLNESMNIIVGNNEQGKSTILEAINLAMSGNLNGKSIYNELNPYIFNHAAVADYISRIINRQNAEPPKILIEVYLKETEQTINLKGTNNSRREDYCGISLSIEFDEEYAEEYKQYIKDSEQIKTVPVEYYKVNWFSFAYNQITSRSVPVKCLLIDTTKSSAMYGATRYVSNVIGDTLELKDRVALTLNYRSLKERFSEIPSILDLNENLSLKTGEISDKELKVSLDISQKNGWESNLTAYLDDIPFDLIGKGEQNAVKLKLALETRAKEAQIILIEEPENHLSFTNMSKLISEINKKCEGKQILVTTHSTYVLNKLGLDKVILLNEQKHMNLKELNEDTYEYFKKLPGYDTLRLLLSKRAILVEGPSDELIVQKAYLLKHKCLPIEHGIDVITVRGLSFKRFLEIADMLGKNVVVVTDNDGDIEQNINKKYKTYLDDHPTIKICYGKNTDYPTLEPQICLYNDLDLLNRIFGTKKKSKSEMMKYMEKNKSDCAMMLFDTNEDLKIPEYIQDAIK
ncbi:ATP-dependent nuclease [Cytobacillus oceanisediminis]|uniref:ATP-dependent nuclease n=1 Tax=Cytobacillus oceanisediminis TaxID=665099 RepID=UPI001FB2CD2F|nr:AAA family ATPase [Cytobacillus oceanisediminis]UOE53523.1 AAA family ATPase [Cytobacillus oceanisediminis]